MKINNYIKLLYSNHVKNTFYNDSNTDTYTDIYFKKY